MKKSDSLFSGYTDEISELTWGKSKMNNLKAAQILKTMNEWRRFKGDLDKTPPMPCPYEFGRAIDYAIKVLEKENKNGNEYT